MKVKIQLIWLTSLMFILAPSLGQACIWLKVSAEKLECRTPYREFYGNEESENRKKILNIAFTNAKRKLNEILNESDVMSLLLESDELYANESTQALDELVAKADQVLQLTNEITVAGAKYVNSHYPDQAPTVPMDYASLKSYVDAFEHAAFDIRPSAYLIGVTVPLKKGVPIPLPSKLLKKVSETLPDLELGSGSVFIAVSLVPQIVDFVAIKGQQTPAPKGARALYQNIAEDITIYDMSGSDEVRLRLTDAGISAFPTTDIRVSKRGMPAIKTGGLKPTFALAWGDSIYRPTDIATWGFSYSLPTALSRVPFLSPALSSNPMFSGTLLGKTLITRQITWAFLKMLDIVGVETAKFSWNSSQNLVQDYNDIKDGVEDFPFDQLVVTVRWDDIKGHSLSREAKALNPIQVVEKARFGVNWSLDLLTALGSADSLWNMIANVLGNSSDEAVVENLTAKQRADTLIKELEAKSYQASLTEVLTQFKDQQRDLTETDVEKLSQDLLAALKEQAEKDSH